MVWRVLSLANIRGVPTINDMPWLVSHFRMVRNITGGWSLSSAARSARGANVDLCDIGYGRPLAELK